VGAGGGVTQVQVEAAVFADAYALAAEERLVGQGAGDGAAHPGDLGLQPEPGNHATVPDAVQHLVDAVRAGET
jgi:hypothetical protein